MSNNITKKLKALRNINDGEDDVQKITVHKLGKVSWINWSLIRNSYVLGKRIEETDEKTGRKRIWSESYTLEELAKEYSVGLSQIARRSFMEGWVQLRDSYLSRVQEEALGKELSYFTNEESETEASSLAIIRKSMKLINLGLEQRYGDLLDAMENNQDVDLKEYNLVDLKTLNESAKTLKSLAELHTKIMEQAPKTNQELLDSLNKEKAVAKLKDPRERQKMQEELQKKLQLLSQIEEDGD